MTVAWASHQQGGTAGPVREAMALPTAGLEPLVAPVAGTGDQPRPVLQLPGAMVVYKPSGWEVGGHTAPQMADFMAPRALLEANSHRGRAPGREPLGWFPAPAGPT